MRTQGAARWWGRLVVAGLVGAITRPVEGQDSTGASAGPREVRGRVIRPGASDPAPVAGVWVTLHRVGRDSSGPVDSVRSDRAGQYAIRYEARGPESVYFASTMYGGVAYFTPPLRDGIVSGDDAEIVVFDTTSTGGIIRVRGRHLVVSAGAVDGRRTIVEVYELSNDSTVTLIAGAQRRATWSAALPPNAEQFDVSQGDITREAVSFRDGRVQVFAPIAPGIRQLAFSYSVPASGFPLRVAIAESVSVLEVLVEDPAMRVGGAGLTEQPPVTIEGRNFRRFLAQDAATGMVATVTAGAPSRRASDRGLMVPAGLAALVMAVALGVALTRRRPGRAAPRHAPASAERLARDIAELDEAFARAAAPSEDERAQYATRRQELKGRLTAALAREEHVS